MADGTYQVVFGKKTGLFCLCHASLLWGIIYIPLLIHIIKSTFKLSVRGKPLTYKLKHIISWDYPCSISFHNCGLKHCEAATYRSWEMCTYGLVKVYCCQVNENVLVLYITLMQWWWIRRSKMKPSTVYDVTACWSGVRFCWFYMALLKYIEKSASCVKWLGFRKKSCGAITIPGSYFKYDGYLVHVLGMNPRTVIRVVNNIRRTQGQIKQNSHRASKSYYISMRAKNTDPIYTIFQVAFTAVLLY